MDLKKISVMISGMHCAACANKLEKTLNQKSGIQAAIVNFSNEKADIEYDTEKISVSEIEKAIINIGYEPVQQKTSIAVGGMHCASCAAKIEKSLTKLNGIVSAQVNLASETVLVTYIDNNLSADEFRKNIRNSGYKYYGVIDSTKEDASELIRIREQKKRLYRTIAAFSVSIPLMVLMYLPHISHHMRSEERRVGKECRTRWSQIL